MRASETVGRTLRRVKGTRPLPRDLDAALTRALAHHRAGRLDEAARGYDAVLSRAPRTAPALAMKGMLLLQRGRCPEAIPLLERALAIEPSDGGGWSNLGNALRQVGRIDDAIAACRRAVSLEPRRAEAHNNLGNALRDHGALEEAEAAFERALSLAPTLFAAASNLAHLLARRGAPPPELIERVDRAMGLGAHARPRDLADLHNLRGNALRRAGRASDAIESYRAAIAIEPTFGEAQLNLGRTLAHELALADAVEPLSRGLALRPSEHAVYPQLALVLRRLGREDEAATVYRAWHEAVPDDPVAAHLAASSARISDQAAPSRASAAYVRREFDGFARSFDEVLLERLGYRGPELVGEALARAGITPGTPLDVLDAGCGTGLGAAQLRPLARRLVGVDLSREMLRQAASRGYDELVEADLIEYAASAEGTFDVVTATEVLLYFGDLEAPLGALASTLREGGRLVLTVEAAPDEVERWMLGPSGRYAHAHDYLRATLEGTRLEGTGLEGTGLAIDAFESVVLRRELGADVRGWLATARRPARSVA